MEIVIIAAVVGVVSKLLGLGGGILLVPVLTLVYHYPIQQIVPASLLGGLVMSVFGSTRSALPYSLLILLEVSVLLGGLTGGYLSQFVSGVQLSRAFAVITLLVALRFAMLRKDQLEDRATPLLPWEPQPISRPKLFMLVGGLFMLAVASSMLGIGGGVFVVPLLVAVAGIPMKESISISHYLIGAAATGGMLSYLAQGRVDQVLGAQICIGLFVGAFLGSRVQLQVGVLRWMFAAVLIFAAWRMGWS